MKKIYLLTLLSTVFIDVEAQNFDWAKKGGLNAYDYGYGVTTDSAGNVYTAGRYEGNAEFSNVSIPNRGNFDIFFAKYSPTGAFQWVRSAGGYAGDYAEGIACDNKNLYVTGVIEGTNEPIHFDGTPFILTTQGSSDIFVAKYTMEGALVWARRAGGYDFDKSTGVAHDAAGNVYICGLFRGTATFGNNAMSITSLGNNDIFVAKYDAAGNFVWVRRAGSAGRDEAKSIACDASGNVYITGLYSNGCHFGTQVLSSPGTYFNSFVAKYNTSGYLQWVHTGGGNYDDVGWSLALDKSGHVFVTGEFNSGADFDNMSVYSAGMADVFVGCYDVNGHLQWLRNAGGSLVDRARGISYANNKVYITGQFGGLAQFGTLSKKAVDSSDIFIAAMDMSGNFLWVTAAGGPADAPEGVGYESGNAVCGDENNNVYVTGAMLSGATFGSSNLTGFGHTDYFVCKLTPNPRLTRKQDHEPDTLADRTRDTLLSLGDAMRVQENLPDEKNLHLYPNPVQDHLTLELNFADDAFAGTMELQIVNMLGQVIETRALAPESSTVIDMSSRDKGIYFVHLRAGEKVLVKRIVVE